MNRLVVLVEIFITATAIAAATPASAAHPWQYRAGDGYHIASIDAGYALFEIACEAGDITAGYYVDSLALDSDLWDVDTAIMAVVIDGSTTMHWVESKLWDDDIEASVGFGGGAADQLAHMAARASRTINISMRLKERGGPGSFQYNRTDFSAAGSAAAIKTMYAACGVPF